MEAAKTICNVGIDVSKDNLDVHLRPSGAAFRVGNDDEGWGELQKRLTGLPVRLVVLEATGGYERGVFASLTGSGVPTMMVNPKRARDFAKSQGIEAKTDRLDAGVLAHFASVLEAVPAAPPSPELEALKELLVRRRQLIGMRTAESNRQAMSRQALVRKSIARHLESLAKELKAIDAELDKRIGQTPGWKEKDKLLQSITGIGRVVSRTLLAGLPELGTRTNAQMSSLAGLAPLARDSGKKRGVRFIQGGRGWVRSALYMGALAASRVPGPLKDFADRLKAAGKKAKVVLVAVARKLVEIANAILTTGVPYRADYGRNRPNTQTA